MNRDRRVFWLALWLPLASIAQNTWQEDYRYGLESLQRGHYQAAIEAFGHAIERQSTPVLSGDHADIDYLPYLHLAVAHYELDHGAQARAALDTSRQHGLATKSYLGRNLWDRYALNIMATDKTILAQANPTDFRDFERQTYVLNDNDVAAIKQQVLQRCALTGKGPESDLPWYFHYEFGIDLMQAGDPQRALDALILSANLREDSKRNSRMYGMWFTNYLPYYQIAQAHSKLGNWRCAMDAMRLSAQQSEFSPVDRGYREYSDLQKLILREAQGSG